MAYVSGHGPLQTDKTLITGRVGDDLTEDQGREAARVVGLGILATLLLRAAQAAGGEGASPAQLREAALQQAGAAAGVMELESAGWRGLLMRVVERSVAQVRSQARDPVSSTEE